MALQLVIAGFAIFVTTVALDSNPWIGACIMLLFVSGLAAGSIVFTSGPPPPWFRRLMMQLSDR